MDLPTAFGLLKSLVDTAICLRMKGYIYTDYKLANILFRCQESGKASIVYADLERCHQLHLLWWYGV
jgi:hypothetical protein